MINEIGKQQTMQVSNLPEEILLRVKDFLLSNVHELNLSCCTGITDVSALSSVHTLNIYGCSGIPGAPRALTMTMVPWVTRNGDLRTKWVFQ